MCVASGLRRGLSAAQVSRKIESRPCCGCRVQANVDAYANAHAYAPGQHPVSL